MTSATADVVTHNVPGGAILFDPAVLPQAPVGCFDEAPRQGQPVHAQGGRGSAWFIGTSAGPGVVRHYRRGGVIARLSRDRYLWSGADATRSFREFRLLRDLHARGLPVPCPWAARYLRCDALSYRADLLMQRIPARGSLASEFVRLLDDGSAWSALGMTLARFHAAGVDHADLNAHNVLLGEDGGWWLIDFDRGRLRDPRGGWWQGKLQRLERSLRKLGVLVDALPAAGRAWQRVLDAHAQALAGRSA